MQSLQLQDTSARIVRFRSQRLVCRAAVARLLLLQSLASAAVAQSPSEPSPRLLEQFAFLADDFLIAAPVRLRGKDYQFVIDTGCATTMYDESLRPFLGDPLSTGRVRTAERYIDVSLFDSPDARLGRLSLKTRAPVTTVDLRHVRDTCAVDIMGVVGMDFLRQMVLRVDFDNEQFQLLTGVPADSGDSVPLSIKEQQPYVTPFVEGWGTIRLLVDTGHNTAEEGMLEQSLFDTFDRWHLLTASRRSESSDLVAFKEQDSACIPPLRLGRFRHSDLRLSAAKQASVLGLRYWARFVATFDFPNGRLYLKPSQRFARGVGEDLSATVFVRTGDAVVLKKVKAGKAADRAGLKVGDQLIKVGDLDVKGSRLQDVRAKFCREGILDIVASRAGTKFKATLSLSKPVATRAEARYGQATSPGKRAIDAASD